MRAKSIRFLGVAAAGLGLLIPVSAQAGTITFDLIVEFSGGTAPEGAAPWLTVTLDDGGTPGSVDLTLADTNLTDAEFVMEWELNLDPALDLNALVFSAPTKTGAFTDPIINTGVDAFMADGDGFFDIQFLFDNSDGAPTRFGVGDSVDYTITGIPSLTASSFDFLSKMGAGQGAFETAAKIGAIGPNDESGWISVPEPGSLVCLCLGASILLGRRRRRI